MWMEQQVLTPGVQNAQKPDLRRQMLRISSNLKECGCAGLEQQTIEHFRIVLAERIQLVRDGEYHMEVGHAEHFSFASGEPALARLRLALWAMPIAARVIRDGLMAALWTVIDMAAECCGAATRDRSQHAKSLNAQPGSVLFHETVALCMEDIGHLHGG